MKPLAAACRTARFGALAAGAVVGVAGWQWPTLFGSAGERLGTGLLLVVVPTVVAAHVALPLAQRLASAVAAALWSGVLVAVVAALYLPTVTPLAVAIAAAVGALVGGLIGRSNWFERRAATVVAVVALAAASSVGVVRRPLPAEPASPHPNTFVFGLDAGTWTILDELMANGDLPNLRRLREEGVSGTLRSEIESSSPRVWTTIATGKTPSKHGVVDFFCTQNDNLTTRRVWEILQAQGYSVGLFQWLVTWPPDPFDPFVVPAWMARGPETHPAELSFIKELELAFQTGEFDQWRAQREWPTLLTRLRDWGVGYLRHGLRMPTLCAALSQAWTAATSPSWELQYGAKRTLQLLLNGDVYRELYRRHQPDFSAFICYGTDNLAHKFWQYHYPDDFAIPHGAAAPFANLLTDYYRAADALLGEVLALLPADTTVAVVSDHGFTSIGEGGESHQRELRPKMSRLASLLELTERDVLWSAVATRGYFRPVAGAIGADAAARRILDFLGGCEVVGGPKLFVPKVLDSGQIEVAINLDVKFERDTEFATPKGPMLLTDLVDVEDRTGNHSIDGIVLLRGPAFRRGARIETAHLADVTPTLLHLNGFAVGADMDGRVLEEAFTDAFREEHSIERIESWDDLVNVTRAAAGPGDERGWRKYASELGYVDGGDKATPAGAPKERE